MGRVRGFPALAAAQDKACKFPCLLKLPPVNLEWPAFFFGLSLLCVYWRPVYKPFKISVYIIHYCNIQEVGNVFTNLFLSWFSYNCVLFISISMLFYYPEVFSNFETIRKFREKYGKMRHTFWISRIIKLSIFFMIIFKKTIKYIKHSVSWMEHVTITK